MNRMPGSPHGAARATRAIDRFDSGSGTPFVVIPGITGRWEWMVPGLAALAGFGRTVSYSLCGEPGSGWTLGPKAPFSAHIEQLDAVLDASGLERAVICGVSLGGWIALQYAATHQERTLALVLVSTPGPRFRPDARQQRHIRAPFLLLPLFIAAAHGRIRGELRAAIPGRLDRLLFTRQQLVRVARAPMSPRLMARRMTAALREDFVGDSRRVQAPTLLVTGEPNLDLVVPAASTLDYLNDIPGAASAVVARTGHQGVITRPQEWARTIAEWAIPAAAAGPRLH